MLPRGTSLGHYRLLQGIGVGGMGEVYLAEDTRIARQVAIKIVRTEAQPYPNSTAAQEASRLFQREMKAIVMLDHRNILNLIDFGEEIIEGMPVTYMIMPYRKEGSLNDWLQRYKSHELLSPADVDYILSQAADALQHAHEHHIIHQDVKPSNFLIRENPNDLHHPDLLLTDFGVAKLTNATATASQHVRGTPAFMPPEQWESQPVPASDQYALAVLAYLLLTGRALFEGRLEQVMRQHLMVSPQPPGKLNPQLSPAIDAVILRALAKRPEDRFPTILDFAHAFHQATLYSGDLRTTLTIRAAEAMTGVQRSITLPGSRRVLITVPQNAQNGQELRIEDQGDSYYENGPRGPLLLKIAFSPGEATPGNKRENLPPIDFAPLPPTVYDWQKQSNELPPTVAVPPPPPPPLGLKSSVAPERPITAPSSFEQSVTYPPQPIPTRRTRKLAIIVLSLVLLFVLAATVFFGIAHESSVNTSNANATATADVNANATADANATTTAFADANATATAFSAAATATIVNANPDPYGNAGGTLALIDPLTQEGNWSKQSDTSFGGSCQFMSDGYHISESNSQHLFHCDDTSTNFGNFVFEVKMTISRGDCGGMALRFDPSTGKGYYLSVCSDGTYEFDIYTGFSGSDATVLKNGNNAGITSGQNTIAMVASGSNFTFYLNNSLLGSTSDSTSNQGDIGLIADDNSNTTEVTYSDARVWTL
jgi:eukaryotic-like serine/threonine-protein kinase